VNAAIAVFAGVEELDAIGPFEVLAAAADLGADLRVSLVTGDGPPDITTSHGLKMTGIRPLAEGDPYDLIVVPGGAWLSGGETGVRLAVKEGVLPAALRARHDAGCVLASVCTGAFLLAEAGLLAGRAAATHHLAHADLRAYGAEVRTERVVDDGTILSAGGVASGMDLALWIIERAFGETTRDRVETYLEYTRRGEVFLTDRGRGR